MYFDPIFSLCCLTLKHHVKSVENLFAGDVKSNAVESLRRLMSFPFLNRKQLQHTTIYYNKACLYMHCETYCISDFSTNACNCRRQNWRYQSEIWMHIRRNIYFYTAVSLAIERQREREKENWKYIALNCIPFVVIFDEKSVEIRWMEKEFPMLQKLLVLSFNPFFLYSCKNEVLRKNRKRVGQTRTLHRIVSIAF